MGNFWSFPQLRSAGEKKRITIPPIVHTPEARLPSKPVVIGAKRVHDDEDGPFAVGTNQVYDFADVHDDGERHRYRVRNAPYWLNKKAMEKLLMKIKGLPPYRKLHKLAKWDHFFIEFTNAELAKIGVEVLSKTKIKGHQLEVVEVTQESRKRRRIAEIMEKAQKTNEPMECKGASEVTAPWRNIPYDKQVERKIAMIQEVLCEVTDALKSSPEDQEDLCPSVEAAARKDLVIRDPCCHLAEFISAGEGVCGGRDFYRNKTELTVGYTISECAQGHSFHVRKPAAGFSVGAIRDGETRVAPLTEECVTTSLYARIISERVSKAICELENKLPVYDRVNHVGYWRQVTIRESRKNGIAVVVSTNSAGVSDKDEQYARRSVVHYILTPPLNKEISVLWHHNSERSSAPDDLNLIRVHGTDCIFENLKGLCFRVNPFAFFQVNTVMAEKMCDAIANLACLTRSTVVLDICCGTGSIGLSLASLVSRVIGIELNVSAVNDAKHNAKLNGIRNATFISGKAEDVIGRAIEMVHGQDCVAVVDPPRAGLHHNVIRAIRGAKAIQRVVYAACEPKNLWKSAVAFCRRRSKGFRGRPFRPVTAIGCDMFPHTKHYELLMSFSRQSG